MSMRTVLAASLSAGVAVVVASPATAGSPPPTSPSAAAIAQYVEAVPSATGAAPVGGPASKASALPPAVRAKVERTAGADAPTLLDIAQNPRYGAGPVARPKPAPAGHKTTAHEAPPQGQTRHRSAHTSLSTATPGPVSAAASTAGSHGFLFVTLLLVAITAAGIVARVQRH